ncbi:MAG: hypothetical protein ABIC95_06255 [archaeon]
MLSALVVAYVFVAQFLQPWTLPYWLYFTTESSFQSWVIIIYAAAISLKVITGNSASARRRSLENL